jgi:hypothetical protein
MQLTGHKNVASVNEYSSASFNQQQQMSNILTDIGTGSRINQVCFTPSLGSGCIRYHMGE